MSGWRAGNGGCGYSRGRRHWRHPERARFFRRVAGLAVIVLSLALSGVYALASFIASRVGLTGWAGPGIIVVVLVAALVAARAFGALRRFGHPLAAVMEAADQVANGDYTVQVQEAGPPPIRALVRSFNTMTAKLHDADRQRRDLMADLAHELRTPLTILQGRIEGLLDGVYIPSTAELEQLLTQTQVLSRLIEDLRTLALSDAGVLPLQREPIDLVQLVRTVVHGFQAQAQGQSISLQAHVPAMPVEANVDPVRIQEVLGNLISNALLHAGNGRTVDVSLERRADAVRMTIRDDGAGMSAEQLAHAFDRFYRREGSRGSGLGLTIARQLVMAHQGTIEVTSEPSRGTTMQIVLPLPT